MDRRVLSCVCVIVIGAFGCGGGASGSASTTGGTATTASSGGGAVAQSGGAEHHGEHGEHGEHHEGGEGHQHNFPAGPVADFHGVLRPVWHSPESPERLTRACTEAVNLRRHADAILAAPVPEAARANEAAWRTAATTLQTDVGALQTECGTPQRASIGPRFTTVHTSFHHLIELLPH